jgi:tRNA(Met) C34 N-acetyltransferase TmcA
LYSLVNGDDWTIIFNKTWNQWGTIYSKDADALRVQLKSKKSDHFTEKFTIGVGKDGTVTLWWGDYTVPFHVE